MVRYHLRESGLVSWWYGRGGGGVPCPWEGEVVRLDALSACLKANGAKGGNFVHAPVADSEREVSRLAWEGGGDNMCLGVSGMCQIRGRVRQGAMLPETISAFCGS